MIVTKHFLFLHNPKTGGIWFRNVCISHAPPSWGIRDHRGSPHQHRPLRKVPQSLRELPTIAVVRNPWDWYVSWFFFNKKHTQVAQEESSKRWAARFADCSPSTQGFAKALPRLLDKGSRQWSFLTDGDRRVDHIARYERLRVDLLSCVEATHAPVTPALRKAMAAKPRVNVSKHDLYRTYYSHGMRKMVEASDADLITEYGFEF